MTKKDPFGPTLGAAIGRLKRERDVAMLAEVLALKKIEEDIARNGWDQQPRLMIVYRDLAPPELLEGLGMDAMLLRFVEFPDVIAGLTGERVASTLNGLAGRLRHDAPADIFPDNVLGWAMVHEAHGVLTLKPGEYAEWDRPLAEHPRAEEIRMVLMVDAAGNHFQVVRRRKTAALHLWYDKWLAEGSAQLQGRLFDALANLADATQARVQP